ncbi:hypothetical protein V6Z12_D09G024100 [Gossypium hirsutum]
MHRLDKFAPVIAANNQFAVVHTSQAVLAFMKQEMREAPMVDNNHDARSLSC